MPRMSRISAKQQSSETLSYPGPEEFNIPPDNFDDYILTIFGPKGCGKSTAAADFPDALTLMFEPMRRGLKIRQLNLTVSTAKEIMEGKPDLWNQIINTTPQWIEDESIHRLNYDSVDLVYESCYHSVCAQNNVAAPGDAGRSSADIWNQIRDEFAAYFNALRASDMQITFISHVKERDESTLEGSKMGVASPSCSPACLKYIKQASDIVLYYGWYLGKRAMMVRDTTNSSFVAPGVDGKFLQPDGKPISIFEVPDTRAESSPSIYQAIKDAFDNKLWDIDTPEDERTIEPPEPKRPLKKVPRKGPPKRK